MTKNGDTIQKEGTVMETLPGELFKVQLDGNSGTVLGYISGRMRIHRIRVLLGDRVEIEFSPHDMTRGRIVRRN